MDPKDSRISCITPWKESTAKTFHGTTVLKRMETDSHECKCTDTVTEELNPELEMKGITRQMRPEFKESLRRVMLDRLSQSPAHFVHQQRGDPDLTHQEKRDIAEQILAENPVTFLARFGRFLQLSDLKYFQDAGMNSYEVNFYLKEIEQQCKHYAQIVKNRRFSAMQQLEIAGEYFSESEMKSREPLLYDQMVGQFLTEEEQQQKEAASIDRSDLRFSTILMHHMERLQEQSLYSQQKEEEECQEEEEEDEEDEGDEEEMEKESDDNDPEISDNRASDIWRQQLMSEFKSIMQEKFMSGADAHFDYSMVDNNPDYDSMATLGQDEEEKFFDSEKPDTLSYCDTADDSDDEVLTAFKKKMDEKEEVEDYMDYIPSEELVTKSKVYKQQGSCQACDGE